MDIERSFVTLTNLHSTPFRMKSFLSVAHLRASSRFPSGTGVEEGRVFLKHQRSFQRARIAFLARRLTENGCGEEVQEGAGFGRQSRERANRSGR